MLQQQISAGFLCLLLLVAIPTHGSDVFVNDLIHGNVKMGVISNRCDNGVTNLENDWDGLSDSPFACTSARRLEFDAAASCHGNCTPAEPEFNLGEMEEKPLHKCMGQAIRYDQRLPTSGPHRPLWPVWGRYSYLPAQRWLHSLEHGGILGLYHPCVPEAEAVAFAEAVAGCLRRHVIAADAQQLTPERPFALLAYRNKVEMSMFNVTLVQRFILSHALNGREHLAKEGQYSLGLISRASTVSDFEDSRLCPGR